MESIKTNLINTDHDELNFMNKNKQLPGAGSILLQLFLQASNGEK
jgi:hypothetical protein